MPKEKISERAQEPSTRSVSATERLREALLDGTLAPKTRLNEVGLSRMLGVSRTPVRAALHTLAGEGLLEHVPNKGYTVRFFPLSELVGAYDMRALAEGFAARLAAERGISEAGRAAMDAALARGDAALADGAPAELRRSTYAAVNEEIHGAIHAAAGSKLIEDVIRLCHRVPQTSAHNVMAFDLDHVRLRHRDHHDIYHAILSREPAEAERLMHQHVIRVKVAMARSFATQASREQAGGEAGAVLARPDAATR